MKSIYIFTIIILSFFNCSSSKNKLNKCPRIYKNNFTEILNEKHITIYENDTIAYNEIRFQCVYSALNTHKVMYDKYGKWDSEIYPSNSTHPILMWTKIDLFSNEKEYTIFTFGIESFKHMYASVMVFDEDGKDVLSEQNDEKIRITKFFADLIKNHDLKKKDFYETYWTIVNPERWEFIKKYSSNW